MRVPPLVAKAKAAAGQSPLGPDEGGSLLHVLAAGRSVTRAAEIGAGSVVDTAWIAAALRPGVPFFTVASDPASAAAASQLFGDDPETTVLTGPWRAVLGAEAPFDFIVVRDGEAREAVADVVALAAPRATLVVEDGAGDGSGARPRCHVWLEHERLDAVRLGAGAAVWVVVAVVRG